MSLITSNPLFNSFITFSKNGIQIANYAQIRAAITTRYKEIYGEDIDTSTSTADGQYIEMLCLIINNMLMSFKSFYGNLDVNTAQGKFLDTLAALTNITRQPGTRSTASLVVTNLSDVNVVIGPASAGGQDTSLEFVDKSGKTWMYTPLTVTTFLPNTPQIIVVECDEEGPVRADAHWIETLVDASLNFTVTQNEPAEIGSYKETDSQLRARRVQALGASGITVLQSLVGALRSIEGIEDIKVYNNDSSSNATFTAKDGTVLGLHSVYVIIRKLSTANIADSLIGATLYEKMTPGIHFNETDPATTPTDYSGYGTDKSFEYVQSYQGQPVETGIAQMAYWKEAVPANPTIVITLTKQVVNYDTYSQSFSSAYSAATSEIIANNVIEYMNELLLSEDARPEFIRMQAQMSDPLFKGMPTFIVDSVTVAGATTKWHNPDTFYKYTSFTAVEGSNNTVTITIQ